MPIIVLTTICLTAFITASCDKLLSLDDKPEDSDQTNQTSPGKQKPGQTQPPKNPSSPPGQVSLTWYVSQNGSDAASGISPSKPLATVRAALSGISNLYRGGKWPAGESAVIVISGRITGSVTGGKSLVEVSGKGNYPPVIFKGDDVTGGTLDAGNSGGGDGRVMYIANSKVTLGDKLLLTGGRTLWGGAVCIGTEGHIGLNSEGELIIDGAEISGNTGQVGGAVSIYKGSASMTSGVIRNNKNDFTTAGANDGGGIYVSSNTFLLVSGGIIENNGGAETDNGGGIAIDGYAAALMTDGKIINNTSKKQGGGVYVIPMGKFEMTGGEISGNTSGTDGGVSNGGYGAVFIHTGGTITGNTP
ncbi:MAG: hypothetical protein LBJ86_02820 [Spirochaetaceae bacterium]|nr:hypothetical protein [Spirochaetaceae bacterium]